MISGEALKRTAQDLVDLGISPTVDDAVKFLRAEIMLKAEVQAAELLSWKGQQAIDYALFMRSVNKCCVEISGLDTNDIGDYDYATAFMEQSLASDTAYAALEANDFPFED